MSALEQRMANLAKAEATRLARAEFKRRLFARQTTIVEAFDLECCGSMTMLDLLRAQWRWGRKTSAKCLGALGIPLTLPVEDLTPRQRLLLLESLRRHGA